MIPIIQYSGKGKSNGDSKKDQWLPEFGEERER